MWTFVKRRRGFGLNATSVRQIAPALSLIHISAEGTTDGVHFRREWYQKWYAYLRTHTVDAQTYWGSLSDPVS